MPRYGSCLTPDLQVGGSTLAARFLTSQGFVHACARLNLLITATICYVVLTGTRDVPGILGNALTIILGFFFGSEVGKKKS